MKIVIDIPDKVYEMVKMFGWEDREREWEIAFDKAIESSIVLPKGHGRLVDENDLVKDFNTFQDAFMINMAHDRFRIVCKAKTIVEADKEGADNGNDEG